MCGGFVARGEAAVGHGGPAFYYSPPMLLFCKLRRHGSTASCACASAFGRSQPFKSTHQTQAAVPQAVQGHPLLRAARRGLGQGGALRCTPPPGAIISSVQDAACPFAAALLPPRCLPFSWLCTSAAAQERPPCCPSKSSPAASTSTRHSQINLPFAVKTGTISKGLKYSLATGNWGQQGTAGVKAGVSQVRAGGKGDTCLPVSGNGGQQGTAGVSQAAWMHVRLRRLSLEFLKPPRASHRVLIYKQH